MRAFLSFRTLAMLLTAALPCLASQCDECEECVGPCLPERLGRLGLPARSRAWLPAAPPDSLFFINSRGFRLSLYRLPRVEAPGDSLVLHPESAPRPSEELFGDEPGRACGRYFQAERRRLRYEGQNLPFTLEYALLRDLSGYYPGWTLGQTTPVVPLAAVADTLPDIVVIRLNEKHFGYFPVVRRPFRQPFGSLRYVDTVRVAGRLLRGVYQYEPSTFGLNTGEVAPRRLYFQPGQGLMGFTYTNQEEWARD